MYKTLRELLDTTPISQFPEIYNYNNKIISDELEYFYDSSTNQLKTSVYAPQGKVQAYNGEFRTLQVDNIIINNPTTIINSIIKRSDSIPHNAFGNNFSSETLEKIYESVNRTISEVICHDASVIVIPPFKNDSSIGLNTVNVNTTNTNTLYQVIEKVADKIVNHDSSINDLIKKVGELSVLKADSSDVKKPDDFEQMKNKPVNETIAYPKTYYYATIVQLKRQGVNPLHINDLRMSNAKQHTYYPASSPVTVNNDTYIAIESADINSVVNIKFIKTCDEPFMFLLNRNDNGKRKYLSVNYDPLNCLQLRCDNYSDEYGTVWSVYNWSGDKNDFKYITI